ncbi:MAG: hypothetical protein BroJett024_43310 [Alphaproteobacteria bacterium]|nr:MAG: hypothetical protein BroJett024_43310 [Alphaproteobacteria bacterium]
MSKTTVVAVAAVLAIAFGALAIAGCGNSDEESSSQAESTDGAFLTEMIPHHRSAIEMAKVAQKKADHLQIKQLADDIVAAQDTEIAEMNEMHQRMFGESAMGADHGNLGLDDQMMGMSMRMDSLETADPFDRAFIDAMIPHHQGAIRMAEIELAEGQDQEVKDLAQSIVDAQSQEIEQMNQWREQWYGSLSPAGGVPEMNSGEMPSHEEMGH